MRMNEKAKSMFAKTLLSFAFAFAMIFASGTIAKAATTTPVAPGQVTGVKQDKASQKSVNIGWNGISNASYKVWISTSQNGTYKCMEKKPSKPSICIGDLTPGTTYWVKIQAFVKDGSTEIPGAMSAPVEVVTAPNASPSTLTHVKSTNTSITIKWSSVSGANIYRVEYGKSGTNRNTYKQTVVAKNSIELKNLSKNSEYSVYVYAGRKPSAGSYIAYSSQTKYVGNIPVKPSKVSGVEVSNYWQTLSSIVIECDKNKAADGYEYQIYTAYKSKDTKVKSVKTKSTCVEIKNSVFKKHNFYKVKVRAYCTDGNGKNYYSPYSSWKYVSPQPDVKLKNTSNGMKVSWDKIQGADRYVVYMSTKKDSVFKKVATTKNTSKVISKIGKSKLKSGKTYYVRVVAQNKVGKKYYSGAAGNATKYWYLKYKK